MEVKRKGHKRHLWLAIVLLAILAIAVVFFRTQWVENYLAHKLIERTAAESNGFYNLSYKKLSLSLWNGELKIEGVKLMPDSAVYASWQSKDSLPNTYMELSIGMIHFKGLNLTWRHDFRKLHFTSFQIKTPDVRIYETDDLARPKKKHHHASTKNLYQMVSAYITELSVNELNLDNASICYTAISPQSPIVYAIQNVSFDAYGFLMNEASYENGKLLFCNSFSFTTNEPQQLITNNDFTLSTNSISLNTTDSLVYISDIKLHSNRKNPGYPENSIDASVQTVSIDGIDFDRSHATNSLAIRSFNIVAPEIETSHIATPSADKKEKTQKKAQSSEDANLLTQPLSIYDIIAPIFRKLTIGEIDIDKARMQYTLYTPKGVDHFKMDALTFKAYNLIMDSAAMSNDQYIFSQNFSIDINQLSGELGSSNHYLNIAELAFNSTEGNLMVENISLKPISTTTSKDYLKANIKSILLKGLNYKTGIEADAFIISQPQIEYTIAENASHTKQKSHTNDKKQEDLKTLFGPLMNHLALKDFKISKASVVVADQRPPQLISYQLKDFDVYATNLLLSEAANTAKGYSFGYGKMGFSFHSFDNYLPGNEYRLSIAQGSYSTANDLLSLRNILLIPQDTLFAQSKSNLHLTSPQLTVSGLSYQEKGKEKDLSFTALALASPSIEMHEKGGNSYQVQLSQFSIDTLAWNHQLFHVGDINFEQPNIEVYTVAAEKKATANEKKKKKEEGLPKLILPDSLYHRLASIANQLSLSRFSISDALIDYTEKRGDSLIHLKIDTTSIALCNVSINNSEQTFSWGQPYFSTCNIKYPLDGGMFDIGVKSIQLINDSLYIGGISYTSPYSMMEFSYVDPKHKSWYDVTINNITLSGIDYTNLLEHNTVSLKGMAINDIVLQNFVNAKTKLPRHKWFPMIYSYLQKAPITIDIPAVDVRNFTVVYEELSRKGTIPGKLMLQDMTGTITNLTNVVRPNHPYMVANLAGKFMGKGKFDIEWQVPIDSLNDHFILSANMGEFDLCEMNQLVTPLAPIEIKSGHLKQMTFRAEGSSLSAQSDMLLLYDSLYAEVAEYKGDELKKHPLVTTIANKLLRHNNANHHALTEIKRDPYHPTFNYIWQIMEPALVESVGISEKKQEEAVRVIGFFDKIRNFLLPKKRKAQLIYPELVLPDNQ